jgi:hypothetical protein
MSAMVHETPHGLAQAVSAAVAPAAALSSRPEPGFMIVCIRPHCADAADAVFDSLSRERVRGRVWSDADVRRRHDRWQRQGITLARSEFDALQVAGAKVLVPQPHEHRVLGEGVDPLKVF